MKFENVSEAFNHYRLCTVEEIEKRAKDIKALIENDDKADIDSLNIELQGLQQAKANAIERGSRGNETRGFDPVAGAGMEFRKNPEAETGDVYGTAEYRSAFFKKLLGKKLDQAEAAAFDRAMMESRSDEYATSSNVSAVLPTSTLNEVISKARKMGGIISSCRAFNMPMKISIPVATPSAKASWHTEGDAVETEKPSIAYVAFDGYEIIKIFSISAKVKTMSISAFEAYLTEELTNCVMACIADGLVNGTGSGQGTGILPGVTWVTTPGTGQNALTYVAAAGIEAADLFALVALLPRGYSAGAKFAMNNKTLYSQVYSLEDANGNLIYSQAVMADGGKGKLIGFDIIVDDFMPDGVILFGNFNYAGYNLPDGITIEVSRESSFKKGLIDFRALAVADCQPIVEEAFVKLAAAE